jgi:hypothetical protein
VSFFHQPSLESKLRSLFDAQPCCPSTDDTAISAAAAACLSSGPCARLLRGVEVSGVSVCADGTVSLSAECVSVRADGTVSLSAECTARPSTRTALSCRFPPPFT